MALVSSSALEGEGSVSMLGAMQRARLEAVIWFSSECWWIRYNTKKR